MIDQHGLSQAYKDQPGFRACALPGCQVQFPILPSAPHKRFCSSSHRQRWHQAEAKAALAAARRHKLEWDTAPATLSGETP